MTTQAVFDSHLRHELDGDVDAIISDYAPDGIVAGPLGLGSGHDHIRASYELVLPLISSLELMPSVQIHGDVVYLTFRAQHDGKDQMLGTDTFVILNDLIQIHTFYAHAPNPASGDQP